MAKAPDNTLDTLWHAIENTALADLDRGHAQQEFERIQYEQSTKPGKLHRDRELLYGQLLRDPQVIADLDVTRGHIETLKKRESVAIAHYDRIRAARGQDPPPLTPYVARQFKILDVLLSGRSPDIVSAEVLAAAFQPAAQFVFGKMGRRRAQEIIARYRKRFIKAGDIAGAVTLVPLILK